jgi:hypothetical protein
MALTENQASRKREKYEQAMTKARGSSGEPTINPDRYKIDFLNSLNWYTANTENKTIIKYAMSYIKHIKRPELAYCFDEASDFELRQIGMIGRLIMNGNYISDDHLTTLNGKIDHLFEKYKRENKPKISEDTNPKFSIQDRIQSAAREHAGEIDEHIDEFIKEKSSDFSAKNYLVSNSISGPVAKRIGEYFESMEKELSEAIKGKDEQLVEGYSYLTNSQLKKFHALVKSIVDDCKQHLVTSKVNRAPRARKPVSPIMIVKNLKYMQEFEELKLKSIVPSSIVGMSELWVYNTKYRKLTVYKGDLSVKGTTIIGYEIAGSDTKTLRKPEEFFKTVEIKKKELNSAFKSINSKSSTPNGRVNTDCILLGVFK